ncbi:MAG: ferrochelatase, partial [Candidatus Omnitrophota bacterium]|nr:ferrochelatase [Candidatus Omnitrophota bacterium]
MNVLCLILFAFLVNIPCGYWREQCPKFSWKWFWWIHASIPFIIFIRLSLAIPNIFIPISIFFAIVGQIVGSRWKRRRMSQEEKEALTQIPDLEVSSKRNFVSDCDVMVVLLNMGGPRRNKDVPEFQKHLFSDSLLIRFPLSFLFQKLFAWLLITFRAKATQQRYQLIGGGSPIYRSTAHQAQALRKELKKRGRSLDVTFGFNYSPPYPADTIHKLKNAGKKYLLPVSLYPHYSKATTGSNLHYLKKTARDIDPSLKFLPLSPYYLHDGYIQAFCDRIA